MLADLIRATMRERGLTQSAAAEELGVPQSILNRWLSGQHVPSAQHCPRVAAFLGVRRDDVMKMAGHWDDEPEDSNGRRREPGDPAVELYVRDVRTLLERTEPERRPRLVEAFRSMVLAVSDAATKSVKIMCPMHRGIAAYHRYRARVYKLAHSVMVNYGVPTAAAA
jgi:transcriptional regulator with XRE-family HTH domain